MTTTQKLGIGLGVIGGILALYFILTAGKPKYRVGDVLRCYIEGGYKHFTITDKRQVVSGWEYFIYEGYPPVYPSGWISQADLDAHISELNCSIQHYEL